MYTQMVVAGILLAILYYECTRLSPGGLVTPIYIALCLATPVRIAHTALVVGLTWAVMELLSRVWILYGKRSFALSVVVSFLLDALLGVTGVLPVGIRAIGYVVPALLVRDLQRQGVGKTLISTGIVTGLCAIVLLWVGVL